MSKSTVDTVDLSTLQYGLVRVEEAAEVADLVNSSFQKDAFFKKPEYVNRTSHQGKYAQILWRNIAFGDVSSYPKGIYHLVQQSTISSY